MIVVPGIKLRVRQFLQASPPSPEEWRRKRTPSCTASSSTGYRFVIRALGFEDFAERGRGFGNGAIVARTLLQLAFAKPSRMRRSASSKRA